MVRIIIILIVLLAPFFCRVVGADECRSRDDLIVTAPKNGARTLQTAITIRGYLCRNYPIIRIRNVTTHSETLTETREICSGNECAYYFAVPVRDLEPGQNRITAEIPGEDVIVEIEVIRTALAGL